MIFIGNAIVTSLSIVVMGLFTVAKILVAKEPQNVPNCVSSNAGFQYFILSPPQLNSKVGVDMKITLHPHHHHTN